MNFMVTFVYNIIVGFYIKGEFMFGRKKQSKAESSMLAKASAVRSSGEQSEKSCSAKSEKSCGGKCKTSGKGSKATSETTKSCS